MQATVISIDLGDKKHAICVLDKDGKILREDTLTNGRKHLAELAREYPGARVAMEVGTHSPWISRFLVKEGMEVFVANSRKLRAIYARGRVPGFRPETKSCGAVAPVRQHIRVPL